MEIQYQGSATEIFVLLKSRIQALRAQGRLSILQAVDFQDTGNVALAKGSGFEALIRCLDGKLVVDLKLGFLLKPFRVKIEEGLRKKLMDAMQA